MKFKETFDGFIGKKKFVSIKITCEEGEWLITITAFGFINIRFSVNDIVEMCRKKEIKL